MAGHDLQNQGVCVGPCEENLDEESNSQEQRLFVEIERAGVPRGDLTPSNLMQPGTEVG